MRRPACAGLFTMRRLMASCFEARWLIAFLRSSYFQAKILLIRIFLSVKERLRLYVSPLPLVSVSWRFNPNGFERCNLWLHITIEIVKMASISPLTSNKCPWTTRIYPPNDLMLTHGLKKEYTMYDKLIKCPRPSVTCKKVELRACDFLLEKCTSSICHGELREIVKARTRRFFRSTFQSWSRIINLTIICYHLCFDLIVKSFFLAVINIVFWRIFPPPSNWTNYTQ